MSISDFRQFAVLFFLAGLAAAGPGRADEPERATDLLDLFARARGLDPAFQVAGYQREAAREVVREARGVRLPVIGGNMEVSKTNQDIRRSESILFNVGRSDFISDSFSISLSQPLYRQDLFLRMPQARAEERMAEARVVAAEQDLIVRLTEAHFEYLAARDNLESATAERTAIWLQLEETEQRLRSGLATITDVHEARGRFALAQASEASALDKIEDSRQALAEIAGEPPAELKTLSEAFPLVEPDEPDVEAWVESALFRNPVIKAREAQVEVARQAVRQQRGARLPKLDLIGSFANRDSGGTTFGGEGGTEIATAEVAVRLGIPIFDGRTSPGIRSAELRERIAMEQLEQEKRRLERTARAAFQGVMSGIARVEALQKSVFSLEAVVALKDESMRSGLTTGLELLDARRDLYRAKRDLTTARYSYIVNGLKLKQAAGVLDIEDLRRINAYLQ